MPLLTIDEARAQCRVDGSDSDVELTAFVASAADAAAAYLNRLIFTDQVALDAAQDAVPALVAAAGAAYATATAIADTRTDARQRKAERDVAEARMDAALANATRTVHGIVANPSILAAVRLTLGHLFANREDVVTSPGAVALQLPLGARALLYPYRRVMSP